MCTTLENVRLRKEELTQRLSDNSTNRVKTSGALDDATGSELTPKLQTKHARNLASANLRCRQGLRPDRGCTMGPGPTTSSPTSRAAVRIFTRSSSLSGTRSHIADEARHQEGVRDPAADAQQRESASSPRRPLCGCERARGCAWVVPPRAGPTSAASTCPRWPIFF
jgi:hypothetical protein